MAHELDYNSITGQSAVFSVRKSMWHGEGIVLSDAPTFAEAMRLSGADYTVETRPVTFHSPLTGATEVPGWRAVVRTDRDVVLGMVSDRYGCIQNRTQYEPGEVLVDQGVATCETGGVIRNGRQAWMLFALKVAPIAVGKIKGGQDDLVVPYLLATTRHDGSGAAAFSLTWVRVVCANTFDMAADSFSWAARTRHSRNAEANSIEAARKMFSQFGEKVQAAGDQFLRMRQFVLTREQFVSAVLDEIAPMPKKERTDKMTTDAGIRRANDRAVEARDALLLAWEQGIGQTGDHSAWEAFNAATQIIDHETELLRRSKQDKVEAAIGGWIGTAKRAVADNLMSLVAAKR